MDSVKEYLDKLEINNTILSKQLKEVYIQKVVYFKEDKIVYFYLTSKDIVSYELLDKFRDELLYTLDYFKDIRVKIRYTGLDRKTNKDIIKRYWNNILYMTKEKRLNCKSQPFSSTSLIHVPRNNTQNQNIFTNALAI